MGGVSIWHWIIVGIVVMLLFGRGKVSELMGDVAKGIKAFKKGMSDDEVAAAEVPRPVEPAKPLEDQRGAAVQTSAGERKAS
jgi:sec-independent protein translocase protein TatA